MTTLHADNPFQSPYPLTQLAELCPDLKPWLIETPRGQSIKFDEPAAVQALNSALLRWQYGVQFYQIPSGYLCPAVPGRLDYLLHLNDLLRQSHGGKAVPSKAVQLLDIGCGANLIYSLLACLALKWRVVATDIDAMALENATQLVVQNQLTKRISLKLQPDSNRIFQHIVQSGDLFDVTVCNPPFHQSAADAAQGSARKQRGLGLASNALNFAGQANELWCDGGERAFLSRMIRESKQVSQQVFWFSSLVSKAENVQPLQRLITELGATTQQLIPLQHGNKQSRVICWTFLTNAQQHLWRQHRWR